MAMAETAGRPQDPVLSVPTRRGKGWMSIRDAAFYASCSVGTMRQLVAEGCVESVPSVSARLSGRPDRMRRERVVNADSVDMYMYTEY